LILPHAAEAGYAPGCAAIDSLVALVWLIALPWTASRAGRRLRQPRVRRALDRSVGVVLIRLGIEVITDARRRCVIASEGRPNQVRAPIRLLGRVR
jgi:threonine/homoserine/homoserine lactone efflux protein